MRRDWQKGLGLVGAPLVLFLALPPIALVLHGRATLVQTLQSPEALPAIFVSLKTTAASLLLLMAFGTPLAAWLSRSRRIGARAVEVIVDLPLVLPPAAAGIGLLMALGRQGLIHTQLPFTAGAVVAAQLFVAAPIYVRSATAAFQSIPPEVIELARLEGAGQAVALQKIVAPLASPILLGGAAMAWARGLGEFGATILFAGNLPGRTQTLPLAVYLGFESNLDQAVGLSVLLLVIAALVLIAARALLSFSDPAPLAPVVRPERGVRG